MSSAPHHDPRPRPDTVVLDLDGTLVDSVYVHVLVWQPAFRDVELHVPGSRIHRAIGMGGDRLVTEVAGETTETSVGDTLRERHPQHLDRLFGGITPTRGASDLLEALQRHRLDVVLASSSPPELTERLLEVLDRPHLLDDRASGSDADSSKPSGELVEVALASVDAARAVMVGDAVWDVRSAQDVGIPCLGLLSGGVSAAELLEAGAVAVHLDRTGGLLDDPQAC